MTAPLHGHNFGGDWIECTDEHPRAGRSSDPEPAPCCGHDPHGDEPCRGRVTDWGGAKFPCPCDGAVPALQATGEPTEAAQRAAPRAEGLPSVEALGRAFHEVASHGGPLTPCGYVAYPSGEYVKVGYDENGVEDEYACLCRSIATAILARLSRPSDEREP